jgi:hypothetical protein
VRNWLKYGKCTKNKRHMYSVTTRDIHSPLNNWIEYIKNYDTFVSRSTNE